MLMICNEIDHWENILDPATLEAAEVSKKRNVCGKIPWRKNYVLQQEEAPMGGRMREKNVLCTCRED